MQIGRDQRKTGMLNNKITFLCGKVEVSWESEGKVWRFSTTSATAR